MIKCVVFGICVRVFGDPMYRLLTYIVSRECILPLSFDWGFQFTFRKVIESNVVFLYFDCVLARGWMCVLGTMPNSVCQIVAPAYLLTLLYTCAPIFTHLWSFLLPRWHRNPMHDIPGIFPAIHTQNMYICTHPYPKVPVLIVSQPHNNNNDRHYL